ncbi:hypothetical protein QBC46DRAFT_399143 [Diplogelasinospora grovesii]|uniref:gamma-glutamylcyclotransferase n=1 Tax=Diplogelasinospora grovesii TaxID=303347 RepID=A0AAN6RZZ6_9PEZI|nr:hypothetical protein QBC46DRAFT_399143 [Diplogelasinospora grovesii]
MTPRCISPHSHRARTISSSHHFRRRDDNATFEPSLMGFFWTNPTTQNNHGRMASRRSAGDSLYFAYGSNLWIDQMAKRCPGSSFKGKGTLEGYRWQINERGVANVVKAPGHSVEGLVFSVTASDERTLDRNEGISKKFYERQSLTIILEEHSILVNQKTSQVAVWLGDNRDGSDDKISLLGSHKERYPALVYVSEKYKDDGPIRTEYIKRMQSAAADAIALGVSRSWVNSAMGRYINPARAEPPITQVQSPRQPTGRLETLAEGGTHRSAAAEAASGGDAASSNAGRPPLQASANLLLTHQSDTVSLQALRESNRRKGADCGVAFPPAMLDGVKGSNTFAAQDEGDERVYLVLVSKRLPRLGADHDSNGAVGVKWSTMDLELANELAMLHFRELWSSICDDSLAGGYSQWERITKGGQRPPGLSWDLNENVCLSLYGSVGETTTTSSATVWVEPHTLIRSLHQPYQTGSNLATTGLLAFCLGWGAYLSWRALAALPSLPGYRGT